MTILTVQSVTDYYSPTLPVVEPAQRQLKSRVHAVISGLQNTATFAYRSLLKAIRNPESFMDIALMPIMFTLMFTFIFGGAIAGSTAEYLPIVIPGILIQTIVTATGTAGTQLREDADKAVAARFATMPIARISPLAGVLSADLVRYAIASIVVFAMGALLGFRPDGGLPAIVGSIAFVMLMGWCLSWLFAFSALKAKSVSMAQSMSMIIMFPLTFLSNAFVPTETMPAALRFFADNLNPLSRAIAAVRQLLAGGGIGNEFWFALLGALAILVVFIPLTLQIYTKRS